MEIVEAKMKVEKVALVLGLHLIDQCLWFYTQLLCAQHYRRAVGIICPDPKRIVTTHALEANPDIRLNVLHHMTQMNGSVGVG